MAHSVPGAFDRARDTPSSLRAVVPQDVQDEQHFEGKVAETETAKILKLLYYFVTGCR